MTDQCEFYPDHENRCINTATRLIWFNYVLTEHSEYKRLCEGCFIDAQEYWKGFIWEWEA
jgi:hypothetical protein